MLELLREAVRRSHSLDPFVSELPALRRLVEQARLTSETQTTALILGEPVTRALVLALLLVTLGIALVNRAPPAPASASARARPLADGRKL